jgi:DNA-directed RNA polymerase alpha subunit
MAKVESIKTSNKGFEFSCEFHGFSVSFVNALRRICIGSIPTVGVKDIQILENTTQMPHEMLRHRVEMIPINVLPDDVSTIRDAKIELRIIPSKEDRVITTNDFVVESGRETVLMKDRDFDIPSKFLHVRANEKVHITGRLSLETQGLSQVSTASTWW